MKIGIISDTHGLLREEVKSALEGCDFILHAGDVGGEEILRKLGKIAPVSAVRGNVDVDMENLPGKLEGMVGGIRLYMTHKGEALPEDGAGYDLVVTGHTHRYEEQRRGGTLFCNPGSCGPRRFGMDVTMALLEVGADGNLSLQRVDLLAEPDTLKVPDAGQMKRAVSLIVRDTKKNRSVEEISRKHRLPPSLVAQVVRLYLTHPGVDVEGILRKMGL